jgi:hypothetical protein
MTKRIKAVATKASPAATPINASESPFFTVTMIGSEVGTDVGV